MNHKKSRWASVGLTSTLLFYSLSFLYSDHRVFLWNDIIDHKYSQWFFVITSFFYSLLLFTYLIELVSQSYSGKFFVWAKVILLVNTIIHIGYWIGIVAVLGFGMRFYELLIILHVGLIASICRSISKHRYLRKIKQ